jgi:hypothetical protein
MRKLFFAGVAAAQIVGFSSPAGAMAFAQLSITGASQAQARCPVTLPLVGFVGGAPNVPFEYWFVTAVDGVRVTRGKVRAMMPATGVAKVADSLVIGGSTNATKANSVQVAALGLGESTPTLSNEAAFSVTCGTGVLSIPGMTTMETRPSPPPRQTSATSIGPTGRTGLVALSGGMAIVPSPPSGLTSTLDPRVCGDHAGLAGFICLATIPAGYLTLVWDWAPSTAYRDLDGYRIYRVDGGRRTLVDTQTSADIKIQAFQQPASGFAGQCFAVSAHKGGAESALSAPFCPGRSSSTQTVTLNATRQRSSYISRGDTTGFSPVVGGYGNQGTSSEFGLVVGYASYTKKRLMGDDFYNVAHRVGFLFDTAGVRGRSIYRASLKLHILASQVGTSHDTAWSCATAIGIAFDSWWESQSWINGEFGDVNPGRVHGPDIALDVTKIVADWASGRASNYGFVLKGESEDMGAFRDDTCLSTLATPSLEIVYY